MPIKPRNNIVPPLSFQKGTAFAQQSTWSMSQQEFRPGNEVTGIPLPPIWPRKANTRLKLSLIFQLFDLFDFLLLLLSRICAKNEIYMISDISDISVDFDSSFHHNAAHIVQNMTRSGPS